MPVKRRASPWAPNSEYVKEDLYSRHCRCQRAQRFLHNAVFQKFGFALERDGAAFESCAGTKEQVRIHVADESFKVFVRKIDPNQRIIQLVERDR